MTKTAKIVTGIILGIALLCVAAVIVALAVVNNGLIRQNQINAAYKTQLENVYEKSYFELSDSVRNLETSLTKLTATNSKTQQQALLTKIIGQADTAQSDLNTLPLANESLQQSVAFTNKTGDFCKYLQTKLANGGEFSASDRANIAGLAKSSKKLNASLCDMTDGMGCDINFADSVLTDGIMEGVSDGFDEINQNTFDYPELIYDGPFSDAKQKDIAVDMPMMTQEDVKSKIAKDLSMLNVSNIEYKGDLKNKLEVYNYEVMLKDGDLLYVQASKNGGMISSISASGRQGNETALDVETAQKRAEQFARALGYDVKPIWVSKTEEGCTYVNLAPVVSNVIIYPDLVKVSLGPNGICGFESFNYLANHKIRVIDKMARSSETAERNLYEGLQVKNSNLALVPKNNKEILCFEFECEMEGEQYFIFVDADTNQEVDIFRVIKGTEGYTVM